VADTPIEARDIAARLGGSVVVKSQVLVGGRGKAGGIKVGHNPNEVEELAGDILGMDIKGLTVKKILIDEAADIQTEIYLGAVLDRASRRVILMASSEGGVEIEQVAEETPDKIIKVAAHPFLGLLDHQQLWPKSIRWSSPAVNNSWQSMARSHWMTAPYSAIRT